MRKIASWPLLLLTISTTSLLTSCASYVYNPQTEPSPAKATPVVTWTQPAPIINPTPLSATQLDATANVPGTFVYTPATGTVLAAGTTTLSAKFTPTDTAHYNTATASVTIVVNAPANPPAVGSGHLAVADLGNNRVLIYNAPFTTGASASLVLGQADFEHAIRSTDGSTYANTMSPVGLAMDAPGHLFVTDPFMSHCRVLEFDPPFATNMDASVVIGQQTLTTPSHVECPDESQQGGAVAGLDDPVSAAVDGQGNLWVTDDSLGRVMEYVPPFSNGMAATVEIGQPFDSPYACYVRGEPLQAETASDFCDPKAAAFDAEGNLWVTDISYGRILEFVPPFTTGMAASLEIGQSSFTPAHECSGISASCFRPTLLAFDPAGNLWVVDAANNRVLQFTPPFSNGMAASLVIGQPDFTHGDLYPSAANTLHLWDSLIAFDYSGIWFDKSGDLFVSDGGNSRILIFVPPFSSGMSATVAIGQPNLTSGSGTQPRDACDAPDANTLCWPAGVLTF